MVQVLVKIEPLNEKIKIGVLRWSMTRGKLIWRDNSEGFYNTEYYTTTTIPKLIDGFAELIRLGLAGRCSWRRYLGMSIDPRRLEQCPLGGSQSPFAFQCNKSPFTQTGVFMLPKFSSSPTANRKYVTYFMGVVNEFQSAQAVPLNHL